MTKKAQPKSSAHPIQAVYDLLSMMGVIKREEDIQVRYSPDEDTDLSIAIPSIRFGIALDNDKVDKLIEQGWRIEHMVFADLEAFSRVFFAVDASRVADLYARADPNVKTTSEPEEKLYAEFHRRRLPVPDRNHKFTRDDGTELTTPDFTWEDEKIAFFMDGSYWHSVKSDNDIIKEIKSSRGKKFREDIVDKRKDKVRKDGAIRSELGAMGWIVLSCTDDDISTPEGLDQVVSLVEKAFREASLANKVNKVDEETRSAIGDLLSAKEED